MYRNFDEIVEAVKKSPAKRIVAVAAAEDEAVLEAVLDAKDRGIADSVLVGDAGKIEAILTGMNRKAADFNIVHVEKDESAGQKAVDLIREGKANFLMKGMMDTKDILKPVVKKENELRTGGVMSHLAFNTIPGYKKIIACTDGGMLVYPSLEEKKQIINNAVNTLRAMGYENPKVAVLAGVEKVNPKMTETVDADALKQMNLSGEITGCVVEGPISYDIAMSKEIAEHKGYGCPYCGDFDVLVVPNLVTGNILGKSWTVTANSKMAGIVVGAKVPIVLNSRGASAEEKFYAMALAALVAAGA